ncbi:MAG TPA: hypothetical protein VFA07_13455 [Chthonomonadaceae bacterium]|nr:hypothetical protein [Chthonomonadaceae bacterium]
MSGSVPEPTPADGREQRLPREQEEARSGRALAEPSSQASEDRTIVPNGQKEAGENRASAAESDWDGSLQEEPFLLSPGRKEATTGGGDLVSDVPPRMLPRWSGWLVGIAFGVLLGLWTFPRVRYTLGAQLQFALAAENVPWMRALDTRHNLHEAPRLNAVAAEASNDYLLQVGRATALADVGSMQFGGPTPAGEESDRTLYRLYLLAQQLPVTPGAYAHLARYLMADRVRIQRTEAQSSPPDLASQTHLPTAARNKLQHSIPARHKEVRVMEWALRSGKARDPDNAFWPAMLATTYFAALRDREGLQALDQLRSNMHWDAYIYEEVLGKWRLYSAAYGDNGAAQQIAPLSLVAFPHLLQIRRMAEIARWHAERDAAEGRLGDAVRIRHEIATLGQIMRDKAQWAYEALYGTDLVLIASMDSTSTVNPSIIRNEHEWEQAASGYLSKLRGTQYAVEIPWLRQQVKRSCDLRQRVDAARYDVSYPGIPPGIPLMPLFGDWMAGICLLQQMLSLGAAALLVTLLYRHLSGRRPLSRPARTFSIALLVGLIGGSAVLLFFGMPVPRTAVVFLCGITALLVVLMQRLAARRREKGKGKREKGRALEPQGDDGNGKREGIGSFAATGKVEEAGKRGGISAEASVEARWDLEWTLWLIALLLLPSLGILYFLRPVLSGLHPVAVLLTNLMDSTRTATPTDALELALLSTALPLAITLVAGVWALTQRLSPLAGVAVGLRRMALPSIAVLMLAYLLLLNQTLRLDTQASRAINEAAQNDKLWILTHSETPSE